MNFNSNSIEGKPTTAKSCVELLVEYRKMEVEKEIKPEGIKLKFLGVEPKDVYNITPPFLVSIEGVEIEVIAGRVEAEKDFAKSEAYFFKQQDENTWIKIDDTPFFPLEDPFVTTVNGEIIFGGVRVVHLDTTIAEKDPIIFNTTFYKCKNGKNLNDLEEFAVGPEGMKDIRIIDLNNGKIGVFTRPRLGEFGLGQIGYMELNDSSQITPEKLMEAKIIEGIFLDKEWGGANQLHLLEGGKIGVIGHIACRDDDDNRHYYATSFIFNPKTRKVERPIKLIAVRNNFPKGKTKRPDLEDVIFVGGIKKESDKWYLYAGLSDAESGKIEIDYPF
ncbi:MAG: DUF1861 family protein [Candidatus Pacebacteria bacterium]|nr:DUF1861 family protein [Candidatus Paceibacterota bacterium]